MALRIGVVAGSQAEDLGGGWTLTASLTEALKSTRSKHEFLVIDEWLQPRASVAMPPSLSERRSLPEAVSEHLLSEHLKNLRRLKETVLGYTDKDEKYIDKLNKYIETFERMRPGFTEYQDQPNLERLERIIEREKLDLIWYMIPDGLPVSVPFIATVWDLEHRKQPYFPEVSDVIDWKWDERESVYNRLLPRSTLIIVGTKQGKEEIIKYYGVNEAIVKVISLPTPSVEMHNSTDVATILDKYGILGEFILYPAQFWPHKNHVNLLIGLDVLKREHGLRPGLALTGSDKGTRDHVHRIIRELQLSDQVFDLGFVARQELVGLYRAARALVFPSFFGPDNLPPLEAFALGCPVIAADIPGARGQLGRGALYFNPSDPHEIAMRIATLLNNDGDCRQRLIEEGLKISRQQTPQSYVCAVCEFLDAFEAIRRCWPNNLARDARQQAPVLTKAGLSFAHGGSGAAALKAGWSEPEDWGTWSTQKRCTLRLNLGLFAGVPISIAFACRFHNRNVEVGCYVEDGPLQLWDAKPGGASKDACRYRLRIDPGVVRPSGDLTITFVIRDAVSPAELGQSADTRQLGIGLEHLWIEESL